MTVPALKTNSNSLALAESSVRSLPAMVDKAALCLSGARSAAEILDAGRMASVVYDMAKKAARFADAKGAHDTLVSAAHRAQADALEIESLAKRRLADEYDRAQRGGEVQAHGGQGKRDVSNENIPPSVEDIGLTRGQIHEARQIRDIENENPGIIREALDELLTQGEEPSKAALNRALEHRTTGEKNNEWYTPSDYIELVRSVLGEIDLDPASNELAQKTVKATTFYTKEDDGLTKSWLGKVWMNPPYAKGDIDKFASKLLGEVANDNVSEAIVITHNSTDTAWFHKLAQSANILCFTRGRIKFISTVHEDGKVAPGPGQGQVFFYFGPNSIRFFDVFKDIGFIAEVRQ